MRMLHDYVHTYALLTTLDRVNVTSVDAIDLLQYRHHRIVCRLDVSSPALPWTNTNRYHIHPANP